MNAVREPSLTDLLGAIVNNSQRVSIATRSWPAILPRAASLDAVDAALTELQRDVAALRIRMGVAPPR